MAAVLSLASASCCVLPIGLTILGLGGSWLALLGPLVEHRSMILAVVGVVIVAAWFLYLRRRAGSLWLLSFASAVFVFALSAPLWEQMATREMLTYWMAG